MSTPQRLNKILAQSGLGSRRSCDTIIELGRVQVNGATALLGQKVSATDQITVDGKKIVPVESKTLVIKFNKPRGIPVTKKDRYAPVTVMDFLPHELQHLYPIGRLDKLSSGLLLFTNDGDLALRLTHPKFEHEKEYRVAFKTMYNLPLSRVQSALTKLTTEIVSDAQTKPVRMSQMTFDPQTQTGSVMIILTEGKNRQIRRLFDAIELEVTQLERVRIGTIQLGSLKPGEHQELNANELKIA